MDRSKKKLQEKFKNELYSQASKSLKYNNIKSCIDLFNVLGIRFNDMSCDFPTDGIIAQEVFDLVCFYKGAEHNRDNISIILDLDLDYNDVQQVTHYSYYMFSTLPNLSFIIFIYENAPHYVFKKITDNKLDICLTNKLIKFSQL